MASPVEQFNIDEYVNGRNELILAIFKGIRPNSNSPWTYTEALTLEMLYRVALVRFRKKGKELSMCTFKTVQNSPHAS
jgi:hypothetical protein